MSGHTDKDAREAAYLALRDYLMQLWTEAGSPSSRTISRALSETMKISHTSVRTITNLSRGLPAMDRVVAVGAYLGGDPAKLQQMWARAKSGQASSPGPAAGAVLVDINANLARIADALERIAGPDRSE